VVFISVTCLVTATSASGLVHTGQQHETKNTVSIVISTKSKTVLNLEVNSYQLKEAGIAGKKAFIVESPGSPRIQEQGSPDLPKIVRSIIIPDNAEMLAEVISSDHIEVNDIDIAPSKGIITRDIDPASVPFVYGKMYQENKFFPENLCELGKPYIMRDFRGQTVVFNAFQFNPVTKVLRIYTKVAVKISEVPGKKSSENVFIRHRSLNRIDKEFSHIYANHFINFTNLYKYTQVDEDGGILIICHGSFMNEMQPFVDWKIQKGIPTEIFNVSTIGTTVAAIKTFVANQYDTKNVKYLLLVGDAAQIPTNTGGSVGGPSDNAYAYIDGNDHYPEMFVGRFSAENTTHVSTQVQKVLLYETQPSPTSAHWHKSIGIASDQGPGDDNEIDYEHIRNLQNLMLGYTYTYSFEYFDGSQGGNDASGSPSPSQVGTGIDDGAGIIVYCGHGSSTSWGTSGYSNTDIASLTNAGKLPFIWSVACVNGQFDTGTCFAEAWLRATNNGQPTGAVATLMSTINQSWDSPMEGQDHMVDLLTESVTGNVKRTFGGLSMNGCMDMIDAYGTDGENMSDTWTLFGDPSLMVYTATPSPMTVTHPVAVPVGTTQVIVNCNTNDALVSLTMNGSIINTGIVNNGLVTIQFPALSNVDTITVTVTAYNKLPYFGIIEIVPNVGPYLIVNSYSVNDSAGNNNQAADYSESFSFNIEIDNVGNQTAQDVSAVLSSADTFVSIVNNSASFGNVDTAGIFSFINIFGITVESFVPDQHVVNFSINISDNQSNSWTSTLNTVINAPVPGLSFINITEISGNGNGSIDPFENINLNINAFNTGHASLSDVICTLSSASGDITINNPVQNIALLDYLNPVTLTFNVSISQYATLGSYIDFTLTLSSGDYHTELTVTKEVGLIVEDWESGNMTSFSWTQGGNLPWIVTNDGFYEGNYAAHSGAITDNQTSQLLLSIDVLANDTLSFYKKVSCEPGEMWGTTYTWYDNLEFFIDNISKGKWDGEVDWSKESYPISSGSHTLKWVYTKDQSVATGEDRAYIDYIVFPLLNINYAPFFTSTPVTSVHYDDPYIYNIQTHDFNSGDILNISGPILPSWLTLTDNGDGTAILSGTPDQLLTGLHDVSISVTDNIADPVEQSFTIEVTDPYMISNPAENNLNMNLRPNPSRYCTSVSFNMDNQSLVNLTIYNVIGEQVLKIIENKQLIAGSYSFTVDLHDLNAGVYFCRLSTMNSSASKKLVITK
jgi:hypothetical protein